MSMAGFRFYVISRGIYETLAITKFLSACLKSTLIIDL